ncbi:hypothetical protein PVAP13_5KG222807 [Panicum virgatum]|uniref:Uncharacterized protein n=1 Tax=Panicum virgatum TaxID=38727 RepID=A0A8T0SL79_PANVG|nr:hypothetical protein PVAP13_5KG222807 [Panicum virgatum]
MVPLPPSRVVFISPEAWRKDQPTTRTMFSGPHIAYDVGLCRMVIAPVELDGSWSCYAWDFKEKRGSAFWTCF